MLVEMLTTDDLKMFKRELLVEIEKLLQKHQQTDKKWLKSREVRKLLDISVGKLNSLRRNGTLPFTKIGGIIRYDPDEIQRLVQENCIQPPEE